jgi:steroid delta-isomerase-like uncharacterized protein
MRRYFSVFEQGNIDLLDELLAPDYVNHTPATPDLPTGPEGVKGVVSMFRSGMPDLKVVIEDMIAEGEKVATRYTLEGTHEGELFGVPPTGQRLSIKSMTVERVVDGKVRDHWRVSDNLEMMQQLGVVPEPGAKKVWSLVTRDIRPGRSRLAPFLLALIHLSAWNRNSANFAITEFSEVRRAGLPS